MLSLHHISASTLSNIPDTGFMQYGSLNMGDKEDKTAFT
jgi:hypothetical protein